MPFCKTGGLADVVGALAQKLGAAGHDVCLFLPKYRGVEASSLQGGMAKPLKVPLGGETVTVSLRYMQWRSVSACFIDHPPSFDRDGLYGRDGRDYPDNDRRFALFSRGALEGAKALGFKPDAIHAHDWQTGLVCAYLGTLYAADPFFARTGSVFTIHNMAYQGNFPREAVAAAGLPESVFTPERLEYYGHASFLKAGLAYADELTTVSPTYAREIQESGERGFGLEGLLRARAARLTGILNGLDESVWDPARDPHLTRRYSIADAAFGKVECKAAVRRLGRLAEDAQKPLVGIVSRLDYQKGLDLAISALEPRLGRLQLAVLGTGDAAIQEAFAGLARRHCGCVYFHCGFDEPTAHMLYAASDIFLMPSRFEPCGLGQMIAMRYGAVPVAARTGGLADTVSETAQDGRRANGFLCVPGDAADLGQALDRALDQFSTPAWAERMRAAMEGRFSWGTAVERYLEIYRRAVCAKAGVS